MKKMFAFSVGVIVILNIISIFIPGSNVLGSNEGTPILTYGSKTPEDYEPENVYYLRATGSVTWLSGIPHLSDSTDPSKDRPVMMNGRPNYFPYPLSGQRKARLVYNQSFSGKSYIQLILNSLERHDKLVNVEIGIDTDNDHNFELVCIFPPYLTTGNNYDGTMEEELFEAYGTWQGGKPPATIDGWINLKVTMTSPNGEPALLYCGFDYKVSWCALPYMHADLNPYAKINTSYTNRAAFAGDTVWFDARDSYDPNDDINDNERIDYNELDRLRYRWWFGDDTSTSFDYNNRNVSHVYSSDSIPKTAEYRIFEVNLMVMDDEGHFDWDSTYIKIYRGNHSPRIHYMRINNVEQLCRCPCHHAPVILFGVVKVQFSAFATDDDGDELTYHWDFDGDGRYDIEGDETTASQVVYSFNDQEFELGYHKITLVVSDGTLAMNDTAYSDGFEFVLNKPPIINKIYARKSMTPRDHFNDIKIRDGQNLIFYSYCSDPDRLPGFDTDGDFRVDFTLKYRWNFESEHYKISTDWTRESSCEFEFHGLGDILFKVTLDVFDGMNITTSEPFEVIINVPPKANIKLQPDSFNPHGNLEVGRKIYFNGSGSHDPNGDKILNYTWDFGDGNKSYGPTPVHIYSTSSEYTVSLIVRDYEYSSTPDKLRINIPYPPANTCLKYKIYPLEVYTLEYVHFDATKTFDPDSDYLDLRFKWYFGDNTSATGESIHHKYFKPGQYKISLAVMDETGTMAIESRYIVNVKNNKPVGKIKTIKNIYAGEFTHMSGSESYDVDGVVVSYLWNFGDGMNTYWSEGSITNHRWTHPGVYTLTLIVKDDYGATNATRIQVEVLPTNEKEKQIDSSIIVGSIIAIIIAVIITIVLTYINRASKNI